MTLFGIVARERARVRRLVQTHTGVLAAAGAVVVLALGAVLLGGTRWIVLPRVVPFAVWALAIGLVAFVVRRGTARLARVASAAAVAEVVEREQRMRNGAVRGMLELADDGSAFVVRAAQRLGAELSSRGSVLAPVLQHRLRRSAMQAVAVLTPVAALAAFAARRDSDGWRAIIHPVDAWRGTLLPRLEVAGAPHRALRGATLRLTVRAAGRSAISIRRRTTGNAWVETALPVANGRATADLGPLDADLTMVASDGRAVSDTVVVRVVDRPFLGDVAVLATYPAYLHRASETVPGDATIRIPRGTSLAIEGHASEPLAAVALVQGRDSIRLATSERRFAGRLDASSSGSWTWSARGASTAIADVPQPLVVEVVPDSAPVAEILAPPSDTIVTPNDKVELQLVASDDHELQSVTLRLWRVTGDGNAAPPLVSKLYGGGAADWAGAVSVDLAAFTLAAGDAVHAQLVARDQTPWGQEGASREIALRVPATEEQRIAARAAADSAAERAAAAAKAAAQLQQRTETAANARPDRSGGRGNRPDAMKYDRARQTKELAADQKQMAERVQQLQQASKALEDRLRAAGALDTALASQLRDAQRLLREALTPEMEAALKKLDNATQQLSSDQARQSLADLAAQQKRLKEALEKSAEILKRAAIEGALQTLRDEAKDLAKAERAIADSATRPAPADRSKQIADRTAQLTKDIAALKERLERERADTAAKQASAALDEAERAQKAMSQGQPGAPAGQKPSAGSPQAGAGQSGAQGARAAADAMQRASDALAEGRKAQVQEWKQELTSELDRSVEEMLQLARQQDALAQRAKRNPGDAGVRSEQSALQQGVQKASERLAAESKRSALVSPGSQQAVSQAEQKVAQATRDATEPRTASLAAGSMTEAATALRLAAASLARDRERAAASQSASGLPELLAQLQMLAQQQGALNGQMQNFLQMRGRTGQQQQQALSPDMQAQARALARAQRDVARKLDDVGDADASGRSAELAREARQLAQTLEQGAVDPTVFERQQRLFRRMLDAGQALQNDQVDESGKRESRPGDQSHPFLPPGGPVEGRSALKYRVPEWNELRGLSPDERRLVIDYFRRLNGEKH